jgi:predicted oxidoreductase
MVSPIVSRGYGKNPRIVTRGYGPGIIAIVVDAVIRGGSKAKRKIKHAHEELTKFTVTAMLVAVNEIEQLDTRRGQQTAEITKLDVRFKASFKAITRLGYLTERIIINAFRVVRRGFKKIED